jgi:hypothetical protein
MKEPIYVANITINPKHNPTTYVTNLKNNQKQIAQINFLNIDKD